MNSQTLLQTLLVLHITGFAAMAGTVAADTTIYVKIQRYLVDDRSRALMMLDSSSLFPVLIRISAALIILTGTGMIMTIPGVAGMLWFRVKMALVIAIIINGAIVGKRLINQLKKILESDVIDNVGLETLKTRLTLMYIGQLLLFMMVFTLSVFKF